jgi:hypothetical protein
MPPADANQAYYELMSPTLLARQPPTPPGKEKKPNENWGTIFTYLESRLGSLRSWRWSWWAYWAVLARFFIPRRYIWLVVANRMWRGHPINDAIIDSTGQLAVRTCRGGMWTGLTSPSRPWFKLGIALPWVELDADGKAWLEDTEQRVYTVLAQSNFYSAMAQAFEDVIVFGTSPVLILEDFEDVVRFYVPCAGEYYLANGARLSINTLMREFTYSVQQVVDFAGLENCPPQVQQQWAEGGAVLDREYVVAHSIEPNFALSKRGPKMKDKIQVVPSSFAWREVYWLKGVASPNPLSTKGFHLQPFMTFRWSTVANDAYGRGPCMDALGDVKQTQTETLRKAEFIEKGVRPPMGANPELKNEPASVMPGMITYMSTEGNRKGFWPLFEVVAAWVKALMDDIQQINERIDRCLFVDLFMAISRMEGVQPRNELELTKRDLERLQELGPVVELSEKELNIGILRVLDIMQRKRMLKPMPKSLQTVPLRIKYLSILKIAQRSAESVAMKDVFATAGALSSAAKAAGVPDPIRVLDLDKAMRHYAELANYPAECILTEDQVREQDKIRAKAQQQAQMPQHAEAAVNAAKTLSETQLPGGNTALGAMMGGQGGGQGSLAA